jgi:hypothetical protein
MNVRIVCAANQYTTEEGETFLLIGARHWDNHMRKQAAIIEKCRGVKIHNGTNEVQGFIDQFGSFYNRKLAWLIAENEGQIIRGVGSDGKLYSENLY